MAHKRVQDQRNKHSGFVNNTQFVNKLSDLKNTAPCSAFRNLNVCERQRQALRSYLMVTITIIRTVCIPITNITSILESGNKAQQNGEETKPAFHAQKSSKFS